MNNPILDEYIGGQLRAKVPPSQIKAALIGRGWKADLVDEAIASQQSSGTGSLSQTAVQDNGQRAAVADIAPLSFKRVSMAFMIVINTVTAGLYLPYWFWTRRAEVNSLSSKWKIPLAAIVVYTVSVILIESVRFVPDNATGLAVMLSLLMGLVLIGFYYVLVFRVRAALIEHLQLGEEGGRVFKTRWSIVFGIYYLQYRLNQIHQPGISQKRSIVAGCFILISASLILVISETLLGAT
jgi:hypothetical protein